jgi:hypothetical protein
MKSQRRVQFQWCLRRRPQWDTLCKCFQLGKPILVESKKLLQLLMKETNVRSQDINKKMKVRKSKFGDGVGLRTLLACKKLDDRNLQRQRVLRGKQRANMPSSVGKCRDGSILSEK